MSGKSPGPAEMLAKESGNLDCTVWEGDDKCKLQVEDSFSGRSCTHPAEYTSFKFFLGERSNNILKEPFPGVNLAYKTSRSTWHQCRL